VTPRGVAILFCGLLCGCGDPLLARPRGLADRVARQAFIRGLAERGPRAVVQVTSLAADLKDPQVQVHAALALGEIGPAAEAARQDLLAAARGQVPPLRAAALLALSRIAGEDPEVAQALVAATRDPDPMVRKVARGTLLRRGSETGR
jgi:HEAT repeat protein